MSQIDNLESPMIALLSGMMVTPMAAGGLSHLPDVRASDTLLCGPPVSHRSSLALHFALYHAARSMLPALFLCRQDGLEQAVPLLPHACSDDDPSLHLLHIKYLNSHVDLQRFACCLHLLQGAYAAIVVEDLSGLFRGEDRNALVRTLALLLDGVRAYRASNGGAASGCPLLVTDSSDEARRPRYIYDRWFPMTLTLSPTASPTGAEGCFALSAAAPPGRQAHGVARGAGAEPEATDAAPFPLAAAAAPAAPAGPSCVYRCAGSHLVLEAVQGPSPAVPFDTGQQPGPAFSYTLGPL